ncbi:MAG: hypothetical protein GQ546_12195 [Gammaproteobacteria bacterium]|nr:hypothetical protein [Gammaproteobacteria bacterium]
METWIAQTQENGGYVASHVEEDFREYLKCGLLCHGFARARCSCGHEFLVAFSCKGHGICPSCNARRMVETAAHLVDHVFPTKSRRFRRSTCTSMGFVTSKTNTLFFVSQPKSNQQSSENIS